MSIPWLQKSWKEFQGSVDPDELAAASSPTSLLVGPGVLISVLIALAYFPPLAKIAQLGQPLLASSLVAIGALLTYTAWTQRCRGTLGTFATLLDNTFYSAGLAVAAVSAADSTGIALAVIHGIMVVLFPARAYALSWLFAIAMLTPVLGILVVLPPSLPVGLVLVSNLILTLVVSQWTRVRRRDLLRQRQLELALGAADKLADESVQAALTTTLLTLGHFLHELRNYQTAIAANLEYVEASAGLEERPLQALLEAQKAQQGQAALLRRTIADLRQRSSDGPGSFYLRSTLLEIRRAEENAEIFVATNLEFEIRGNAEHFRVVMLNLTRNAIQAGARKIHCSLRGEASGTAVQLTIMDDGKGIGEEKRKTLFDSFALSDKPGGSGLGLYLIRRYIELLGGTIEVAGPSEWNGATFLIRLPAKPAPQPASTTDAPPYGEFSENGGAGS